MKTARTNGAAARPAGADLFRRPTLDGPALSGPGIDWAAWRQHVARRHSPVALSKIFATRAPALGWGLDALAEQFGDQDRELVALADRAERGAAAALEHIRSLIKERGTGDSVNNGEAEFGVAEAIGLLAWARALPALCGVIEAEAWFLLLDRLIASCSRSDDDATSLSAQLLNGELPLTLGYLFPELSECASLLPRGWQSVEQSLRHCLDEEGMLPDVELASWPALAASWTRSRMIAENAGCAALAAPLASRYQQLLVHLWRLRRPRGGHAFAPQPTALARLTEGEFWRAARCYAAAGQRALIHSALKDGSRGGPAARRTKSGGLARAPTPAIESETSGLAILRPSWATSDRLVVDYRRGELRSELIAGGEVLMSGVCGLALMLDGAPLAPISTWEQVCWVSDGDADYLELQLSFDREVRVQRHLLLAREDRFLLWADAVLGATPGKLEYHCTLPLAEGIAFQPATETREGSLVSRRRRANVLPLALPEWRDEPCAGRLTPGQRGLELSQAATQSRAMFAPLWIDLHPRRLTRPVTWRRLTVAEDRAIQSPDVAAGYRVAAGREQWLIYRSLDDSGNRTVLGHNLVTEFFAGRFSREGVAEPLMEIEPASNDGSATP